MRMRENQHPIRSKQLSKAASSVLGEFGGGKLLLPRGGSEGAPDGGLAAGASQEEGERRRRASLRRPRSGATCLRCEDGEEGLRASRGGSLDLRDHLHGFFRMFRGCRCAAHRRAAATCSVNRATGENAGGWNS